MLNFLKKIFGLPTDDEIAAAKKAVADVPYKIESPVVNTKTGDVVDTPVTVTTVNPQITDAVTQVAPTKKPRKPRTPKVEKVVKEKAVAPKKTTASKVTRKSKKS